MMKIFDKNEMLLDSKSLCTTLKRTMVLKNVGSEWYHQDESKEKQWVSVSRNIDTNELLVTINIDKIKEILKNE